MTVLRRCSHQYHLSASPEEHDMLIDRYFDQLFHRPVPRIPSRLVRYGIIYGDSAKNALAEFEPRSDPMMKRQSDFIVE